MKRIFNLTLLVTAVLFGTTALSHAAVRSGSVAPDFTLTDTNGQDHALSQYKGKYVVLEWINHDCPFVKKHYNSGNMQKLQKTYGKKNVVWLSINSSAHGNQGHYHPEEANRLTQEKDAAPAAVLMDFDGNVGRLYGAKTTPHMYVIDPSGILIYQGAIDDIPSTNPGDVQGANNFVQQALEQAMSGQTVSVAATKAYGCSVKY